MDGRARHIREVLKVTSGQQAQVGIIDGPRGTATVVRIDGDAVILRCAFDKATPPLPAVDLMLALPRPKVMKRLWPQLAAIGVRRIFLVNASRVERQYFDTHVLSPDCYRPLLVEGLQQARDTRLPLVSIHRRLKVFIEDELDAAAGDAIRLVAHPGTRNSIRETLKDADDSRCLLAVGPEGGWSEFERSLLDSHGFRSVGMLDRALRSDTACIALLALTHETLTSRAAEDG